MSARFDKNIFLKAVKLKDGSVFVAHLSAVEKMGFGKIEHLPYSIKVLLENALRHAGSKNSTIDDIEKLAGWPGTLKNGSQMAFWPGRVLLQDFTGVPCLVDLAAMRSALKRKSSPKAPVTPTSTVTGKPKITNVFS